MTISNNEIEQCCVVECERPLDQMYWNNQYEAKQIGWDLGKVSPPIKTYIDGLARKDLRILIPGCGNTYEADYLLAQGFTNVTAIDIAPFLVEQLQKKYANNQHIKIILGDFFEHSGEYDLILEQTFFCALPPFLRQKYVWKMHQLLATQGKIAGLLFNRTFENSPPFGGSKAEYTTLFSAAFLFEKMDICPNSIAKRANEELWIEFKKNEAMSVSLYTFEGITCSGCQNTITEQLKALDGVFNASINGRFDDLLLVSSKKIPLEIVQKVVSYEAKYKINSIC